MRKSGYPALVPESIQYPVTPEFKYYHDLAELILPHMPGISNINPNPNFWFDRNPDSNTGKVMHYAQFVTLAIQRGMCDAYNIRPLPSVALNPNSDEMPTTSGLRQ